ncbi:hypothetical protein QFC22_006546 [Naganishia vaughanmartiniae]|uniref:Uncharacterized protein n=1 Tax=Naganishia vaughanmartiniae TaxID=1424756 RepID=A0ACC2WIJ5_9TREE|nr:hypothetical protein QFC22_006546 [Naganishia vaughanmartiniae]
MNSGLPAPSNPVTPSGQRSTTGVHLTADSQADRDACIRAAKRHRAYGLVTPFHPVSTLTSPRLARVDLAASSLAASPSLPSVETGGSTFTGDDGAEVRENDEGDGEGSGPDEEGDEVEEGDESLGEDFGLENLNEEAEEDQIHQFFGQ